jgi:hypothetical protein
VVEARRIGQARATPALHQPLTPIEGRACDDQSQA